MQIISFYKEITCVDKKPRYSVRNESIFKSVIPHTAAINNCTRTVISCAEIPLNTNNYGKSLSFDGQSMLHVFLSNTYVISHLLNICMLCT